MKETSAKEFKISFQFSFSQRNGFAQRAMAVICLPRTNRLGALSIRPKFRVFHVTNGTVFSSWLDQAFPGFAREYEVNDGNK